MKKEVRFGLCFVTLLTRLAEGEGKRATKTTLDNSTRKMVVPFAEMGKLKEEPSLEDASRAVFGTRST